MTWAGISRQGLGMIAVLVALLWGCLVGERVIVSRANQEVLRALRDMRRLQKGLQRSHVDSNRAPGAA